jgi:hypothetical protein
VTGPFIAQTWNGEELLSSIDDLSFDAARHVAIAATLTGHTGRMMSSRENHGVDYCEVYTPDGNVRRGTFAETTLVHVEVSHD